AGARIRPPVFFIPKSKCAEILQKKSAATGVDRRGGARGRSALGERGATAKIHFQPQRRRHDVAQVRQGGPHGVQGRQSDEVLPILLEEIVTLGYARAAVLEANLQGGDLTPVAALNWPQPQLARFTTMLWMLENPLAGVLASNRPAVLPRTQLYS